MYIEINSKLSAMGILIKFFEMENYKKATIFIVI